MGKLEAVVEKKMDAILMMMQQQLDGQIKREAEEQQQSGAPKEP